MKSNSKIVKIIKKVLPAVVTITVSKKLNPLSPQVNQDFYFPTFEKKGKYKIGGGSGFIVRKNGIILTNRHVLSEEGAEYTVILEKGRKYKGKIIAKDLINDIAILKINEGNLPVLKLGDSSKLELGETVIAVGNSLGLFKNTVSVGVVSGLSREITAISKKESLTLRGLIQTDAAINPGNSGGPLVNLKGEVIGINCAMVLGAENIGFALPINPAKKDLEDLEKYGRIRKPFLGIRYILIDKTLQQKLKLPVNRGALIIPGLKGEGVLPNSPGEKAGLKEGDIILEIENKKISKENDLIDLIQTFQIGKELEMKILRKGKEKLLKIVLTEKK